LVQIVTEPKNALVKQYQKQLSMNKVQLKVTKDGLSEMAKQAIERGTGARALRSIFEGLMLDVMFEVPSREDIESVTVNAAVVKGDKAPTMKKRRSNAA
jgi:ATP-dependent Clp protease ATP-binding subunit ClpX